MPRIGNKTNAAAINSARKKAMALELRLAGLSFNEIAAECGYNSRQAAHDAVKTAIAAITREKAEDVLQLDLERLDKVFGQHYLNAIAGDVNALNGCLRVMERRARLLGIDAPVRTENKVDATIAGGVLAVPGMMDEISWLAAAKISQEALAAKETAVVQAPAISRNRRRVEE